jgi:hypothetical protein
MSAGLNVHDKGISLETRFPKGKGELKAIRKYR